MASFFFLRIVFILFFNFMKVHDDGCLLVACRRNWRSQFSCLLRMMNAVWHFTTISLHASVGSVHCIVVLRSVLVLGLAQCKLIMLSSPAGEFLWLLDWRRNTSSTLTYGVCGYISTML
jgi:hypothetical protein